MELHASQLEELNASAKIAPCGWGPITAKDKIFVPMPLVVWLADRLMGTPQYYVAEVRLCNRRPKCRGSPRHVKVYPKI